MTTIWTEKQIKIFKDKYPILSKKFITKEKVYVYKREKLIEFNDISQNDMEIIENFELETELIK